MKSQEKWQGPARYEIKVKGLLGNQWLSWFEGVSIETEGGLTTITADVPDQSALHGLIARVRDLGLPLISINRFEKNGSVEADLQESNTQKRGYKNE